MTAKNASSPVRILFIDDVTEVLWTFSSAFANAGVELVLHHHTSVDTDALLEEVRRVRPDVVLLDANLSHGVKGYDLPPLFEELDPVPRAIGFSTDASLAPLFLQNGAVGFVEKRMDDPLESVRNVMDMIGLEMDQ